MKVSAPLRVAFVFASRGIGGAERSMLRLMARAHPDLFACRVIVPAPENRLLRDAVASLEVPYHALRAWDLAGLYRLLRAARPDVLYVFGRFRSAAWAAVGRLAAVRCIVAAERSAASRHSDRLARRLDRRLVAAYLANSHCGARNLRAAVGNAGPPVWVVPNGIDPEPASPVEPSHAEACRLLCVGNISDNKGQLVLLQAVRLLRPRHPGLRATLVGRDLTGGGFLRAARAQKLEDTYTALGFLRDVRPWLDRATVVVLPTLRREGMPTSLLEAMLAGAAVVASSVGGVCEVVEHEMTGLLVPPGDAAALAAALHRLLVDAGLRSRLAERARSRVLERHGLDAMVDGHRLAFSLALARAGRPMLVEEAATIAHVTTADSSLRYLLLNQLGALRTRGYSITGVSAPGPDVPALEAEGIPHEAVPMTRRLTPLADLLSLVRLYRLMRRRRFTIVHTHNPKPGLLAQLAARLAGVPVVVNTVHGFYFHDGTPALRRRFYVALERLAARCSDLVLSQNQEDVATAIRERIVPHDRIRYLGNGIDLRRFDPARLAPEARRRTRASLHIPPDAPVVGFVGRLVAEKGVRDLFQAIRLLRTEFPGVRLLVVGGADPEKADRVGPETARELGVAEACVFAGVRQDMPELYAAMDVFTLPSYREGFPRAPLEASAMKLSCVVTDVRGCRQAVADGRNGRLVPPGDVPALAAALATILADPVLARRYGEEGRRRALQEFDERRVFEIVRSEYERLLAEKGLEGCIPRLAALEEPDERPQPVSACGS